MQLPLSAAQTPRLVVLERAGSTNTELRDAVVADAAHRWPPFSAVVTTTQTHGRGRLGRVWTAPPGEALAVSVLLRPIGVDPSRWGWFPLLAGLAMARAVSSVLNPVLKSEPRADAASVKWPNDVLVGGRKISGILTEVLPQGDGIIVGAGLNLSIPADRLPTPTSTSLRVEGAVLVGDALADAALARWLQELRTLGDAFVAADGDAESSGIRHQVEAACSTVGTCVEGHLPGGTIIVGRASAIDAEGRLVITRESDGVVQSVAAGDVVHLR